MLFGDDSARESAALVDEHALKRHEELGVQTRLAVPEGWLLDSRNVHTRRNHVIHKVGRVCSSNLGEHKKKFQAILLKF